MKNILLALLFIFALSIFNIEDSYAECFLFDGTYIGATTTTDSSGKSDTRPLFIVVANKHITGFFAPENQKHSQGGSSFNLGDLTASSTYTLSLTADDKILVMSTDGTVNGKAKSGTFGGGSDTFSGYYNSNAIADFAPGDFLNIGSDGSAILKVAIGKGVVHAFGKINPSGKFVQAFPEKGKGPRVEISFSGGDADIDVSLGKDLSSVTLTKFPAASCSGENSASSSGGPSSNKPAVVTNFQNALNGLSGLLNTQNSVLSSNLNLSVLEDAIRRVKIALLNTQPSDCNNQLKEEIQYLSSIINQIKTTSSCGQDFTCTTLLFKLGEDQLIIQDNSLIDENSNGVSDICEQYSVFSGEKTISLSPILKKAINDINNSNKKTSKEIRKVFGEDNRGEFLLVRVAKSIRIIKSALRLPGSLCSLRIKLRQEEFPISGDISNAYFNLCFPNGISIPQSEPIPECVNSDLGKAFTELRNAGDTVENLIYSDNNKNEIPDVCE